MAKNTIIFQLSRADVVECIRQLDLPYVVDAETTVTDEFLHDVQKGIEWGLECWSDVMKVAVMEALEDRRSQQTAQLCLINQERR